MHFLNCLERQFKCGVTFISDHKIENTEFYQESVGD